jgi:hypothetical protein
MRWSVTTSGPESPSRKVGSNRAGSIVVVVDVGAVDVVDVEVVEVDVVVLVDVVLAGRTVVVVALALVATVGSTSVTVARVGVAPSSEEVPRAATVKPMVDAIPTTTATAITTCRRFNACTTRTIGRSTRSHPNMSDPLKSHRVLGGSGSWLVQGAQGA